MTTLANVHWNPQVSGEDIALMLLILVAGFSLVIGIIAVQWRKVRVSEAQTAVKLRMVERGFSPEEIEQVLAEKPRSRRQRRHDRAEQAHAHAHAHPRKPRAFVIKGGPDCC